MTPERWRQIEELYNAARERGPIALADTDPELRREVERLLAQDSGDKILDRPAVAVRGIEERRLVRAVQSDDFALPHPGRVGQRWDGRGLQGGGSRPGPLCSTEIPAQRIGPGYAGPRTLPA